MCGRSIREWAGGSTFNFAQRYSTSSIKLSTRFAKRTCPPCSGILGSIISTVNSGPVGTATRRQIQFLLRGEF